MRKTSKIIIGIIIAAVLLLGVGYAAIQNVTLNISGTATADPSQSNFKVMFSGTPEVSDATKVVAAITNDTNATINVSGLTAKGESVTATYTVQNASSDLSADLSVATTNSNTEYFTLKADLAKTSLIAGEATTLTVTVTLTKTPVSGQVSSTIGIQTIATPVEPGKEGTSGSVNGSSQTPGVKTLAEVTKTNIGDYVDLGNNYIGTESTSDDWRVFSIDDYGVTVILNDFLPSSNEYILTNGSVVQNVPNRFYGTDAGNMARDLSNATYWTEYTNNISGAVAYGGLTLSELMTAAEENLGIEFAENFATVGGEIQPSQANDYGLYLLYFTDKSDKWCLRDGDQQNNKMWEVKGGSYAATVTLGQQYLDSTYGVGLRPIVWIPNTTEVINSNGVWEIVK